MSKQVKGKLKSMFAKSHKTSGTSFDKGTNRGIISKEILKEIDSTQTLMHRVRNLKELAEIVTAKVMEEHDIDALLYTITDMLDQSTAIEGRHAALQFLIAITNGQYERLGILRSHIFRVVVTHEISEDLQYRIALLKVLTNDGKNISYCEQIGPFLENLMANALGTPNSVTFLGFLVQIVHYNSSFLDKNIICSIVRQTCEFCNNANGEQDIESSLQLLDATVRYGGLPAEGLLPLIETLCRTVNIERFCQSSWKLMRNLIGTRLGHTAVFIMCQILEDNTHATDVILLRGAVFFIGMSIWGSKRVSSLRFSPLHVLASFKVSLQCNHHLVAHEVILSLQRLVKKFGEEQEVITWDIVMDIIETLLQMIYHEDTEEWKILYSQIHVLLTSIECLYVEEKFYGSPERFFKILTNCAKDRPEESVWTLLRYYEDKIDPNYNDWKDLFEMLVENYLKDEKRSAVRVKVLETILHLYSRYRHRHEDELLPFIIQGHVGDVAFELGKDIRKSLASLLSFILQHCSSDKYPDVLKLVGDFLSYIGDTKETEWESLEDLDIVVDSLIKTFYARLFEPCNPHVVGMIKILIKHVNDHYKFNVASVAGGHIRKKIFQLLLALRADENHFMGVVVENKHVKYSNHAIFKPSDEEFFGSSSRTWLIDCDFRFGFEAILKCLKNELDWNVLEYVLKHISAQMENKNLYVFCQCNINKLCTTLCMVINDKTYLNKMKNCPTSMSMPELRNLVFPVLSTLSTYNSYLSRERQYELVTSVEFGLQTRSADTCVSCLTICILEMQAIMRRVLPSILVKLSQISATVAMSSPILKFLSTLKEIPLLYSNFIEEQYMSIFAMALPYTVSYKYSPYIVTAAYQVISDWFTRCRLMYRKGFVSLIVKALRSNSTVTASMSTKQELSDKSRSLHDDMIDVCLDMMARYSFSLHSAQPKRSGLVDFLLSQGSSQTWLLGNMLITITTSPSDTQNCLCYKFRKRSSPDEENSSMSTFQLLDSIEGNEGFVIPQTQVERYMEDEVSIAPPLVKLTQKLVEQNMVFSPSEKLLFSRQASKVVNDDINEGEESSESDEEFEGEDPFLDIESSEDYKTNYSNEPKDTHLSIGTTHKKLRPIDIKGISHFKQPPPNLQCQCQCSGWAEILIQRPTGKISWLVKTESRESIPAVDFSDLSLLTRNIDREVTNSISESLKSADSDVWNKLSQGSDTSSTTSTRRRRFSTGSIDMSTLQLENNGGGGGGGRGGSAVGDAGVFVFGHVHHKPLEKRAVGKTLSQPTHPTPSFRRRASSVVNTLKSNESQGSNDSPNKTTNDHFWSPNFVFLQLFYSSFGNVFQSPPVLLEQTEAMERTLKILGRIPAFNTHKFGVLYVGRDQVDEVEILQNEFGGVRYTEFLSGLGELISLNGCLPTDYFTGGLSNSGEDGKFACIWRDDTTQVVFHVATLMPVHENDKKCISIKRHIGNNFVTIIYDESDDGYAFGTIKGQFNLAEIIIRPMEYSSNVVTARIKKDNQVISLSSQTISDENLAILVRQLAIHTNMSLVSGGEANTTNVYGSNWLERLRQIKRIRAKAGIDKSVEAFDFTNYT